MNYLYYGDNLEVLRRDISDESVDLVYLDPPFNSNATYNVLFADQDGSRSAAQIQAFEDAWRWDEAAVWAYRETVEMGGPTAQALKALRDLLGDNNMTAYLAMMAPRLAELRRILKPTGSIYLHCDSTASHYLKILMDSVFGANHFVNEIIWHYRTFHGVVREYFPRKHDTILFYGKTHDRKFFRQFDDDYKGTIDYKRWAKYLVAGNKIYGSHMPLQDSRFMRYYRRWVREHGREPGPKDLVYQVQGQALDTVWDIKAVDPKDSARLGYPTQKPEELIEVIIKASSEPGDVVLDPFCGCGTTIAVAHRLDRRWIGIDITHLAVGLMKHRLVDTFGEDIVQKFEVRGEPTTIDEAEALAKQDRYQFEWWALGKVGARRNEKKGADSGIDGRLFFHDEAGKTRDVVLQVKSGNLTLSIVRDFGRVIEREAADIGVLLTMNPATAKMRAEAASLGMYKSGWGNHPRYQIITIEQLLGGARIDMPPAGASTTFKRAQRYRQTVDQLSFDTAAEDPTDFDDERDEHR